MGRILALAGGALLLLVGSCGGPPAPAPGPSSPAPVAPATPHEPGFLTLPAAPVLPQGQPAPVAPPPVAREKPVARELFERVEQNPADAAMRRELGIALFEANRMREALEHFEKVVAAEPTTRHLLDLALCFGSLSRSAEAQATYERILKDVPNHAIAMHNLGNLYLERGDSAEAIRWYRRAIEVEPEYLLAFFHLGQALKRSGDYRQAYETFEQVLMIEPAQPTPGEVDAYDAALFELAALDLEMGAYPRAASFLEELIKANPEHPTAYYTYGRALTMLGRTQEAQRAFDSHMKLLARKEPEGPVATGGR